MISLDIVALATYTYQEPGYCISFSYRSPGIVLVFFSPGIDIEQVMQQKGILKLKPPIIQNVS